VLPAAAREDDDRDIELPCLYLFEKVDSVHLRHFVVCHDNVEMFFSKFLQGISSRFRKSDLHPAVPFKKDLRDIEECGFIIDEEDRDHGKTTGLFKDTLIEIYFMD